MFFKAIKNSLINNLCYDDENFTQDFFYINLFRSKFICIFCICLQIITTIIYLVGRAHILFSHTYTMYFHITMIIISTFWLFFLCKLNHFININKSSIYIVQFIFAGYILFLGALAYLIDQPATDTIFVYPIIDMAIALTYYLKPNYSLIIYLFIHILFIVFSITFEKLSLQLSLNIFYSTIFVFLSWTISTLLYKNKLSDLKNRKLIELTNSKLLKINSSLNELCCTDFLTGIANRREFDNFITLEWTKCKQLSIPLSVIMIDVDFFKLFNDNYGHQTGDYCLKKIGQALSENLINTNGLAARYGGEEFIVALENYDKTASSIKAESIKKSIANLNIPHNFSPICNFVTISIGVSTVIPSNSTSINSLIKNADIELYKEKEKHTRAI